MISLSNFFLLPNWRDLIEIIFFSSLFYYVGRWLKGDRDSKLIICFYGYCLLILTSALLSLPLLYSFLCYFAPVTAMLFILLHQKTLQHHFIALRRYTPAWQIPIDWHQELVRLALILHNKGISLHIIIEHKDSLETFISASFSLNAPFQPSLLQTLISSSTFEKEQLIWLKNDGTIVSINASLKYSEHSLWKEDEVQELPTWQQDAIVLTSKTDALVISSNEQNGFTVIVGGTIATPLCAENSLKILKKHMQTPHKGTTNYGQTKPQKKQKFSS